MGKASRRKKERSPGHVGSSPISTKFLQNYGPDFLLAPGPLFLATWWLPSSVAQIRASIGEKLPPPKRGAVLLDTGADRT